MDRGRIHGRGRAQSSVIGVVLIIGMTVAAASAVVVFGGTVLDDGRQQSQIGQAEQAMTQFDSRTAQVALGDSDAQTVRLGQGEGRYQVDETAGRIRIYHEDWNKSNTADHKEEIYEQNLGAVIYENGGTTIAYQGGGVWRHDEDGGSTMVSPPEVHNRKATLTLPIVRVKGSDASSGDPQATVRSVSRGKPIFPDLNGETTARSNQYSNSSETYYENPVATGNMTVEIESDYCEAWRSYFLSRTDGRVDDCSDGVVTAQIVALGAQGSFDITGGGELSVRGVETMDRLVIRMEESNRGSSTFNRLDWTMSTQESGEEFGIHFEKGGGSVECGASMTGQVFYSNDTVNYTWSNETAFKLDGSNCADDEGLYLEVDLLNESIDMTGDTNPTDRVGTPTLGELVKYYFEKFGDMDMSITEGNNAYIGDTSTGHIEYEGTGQVVTFLHVTENQVDVSFG